LGNTTDATEGGSFKFKDINLIAGKVVMRPDYNEEFGAGFPHLTVDYLNVAAGSSIHSDYLVCFLVAFAFPLPALLLFFPRLLFESKF
jgi:hypothetical protein